MYSPPSGSEFLSTEALSNTAKPMSLPQSFDTHLQPNHWKALGGKYSLFAFTRTLLSFRESYNWYRGTTTQILLNDTSRNVLVWTVVAGSDLRIIVMNLCGKDVNETPYGLLGMIHCRVVFPIPEPYTQKNSWGYELNTDYWTVDDETAHLVDPVDIVKCSSSTFAKYAMNHSGSRLEIVGVFLCSLMVLG